MRSIMFAICLISVQFSFGQDENQKLAEARSLYESNNYLGASEKYQSIYDLGFTSAELLYNMANAYQRADLPGKSALYYEKCLKLSPGFKPAKNNLIILNKSIYENFSVIPDLFLVVWWRSLRDFMVAKKWKFLAILSIWVFVAITIVYFFFSRNILIKKSMIPLGVFTVFFFIMYLSRNSYEHTEEKGVITMEKTYLYFSPDSMSNQVVLIPPGMKVLFLDHLNDWKKVELSDKEQGWVHNSGLEGI